MCAAPLKLANAHGLAETFHVSRETVGALRTYQSLLGKWQGTLNLVSPHSMVDSWHRHFIDSLQLLPFTRGKKSLLDLGSGAGFPGMVLAICSEVLTDLVESDRRKAAFLRTVARTLQVPNVTIHARRIEELDLQAPEVITARALAPLPKLLNLAEPFCSPATRLLFLKGRGLQDELHAAQQSWALRYECHPSLTDARGQILLIHELRRERAL